MPDFPVTNLSVPFNTGVVAVTMLNQPLGHGGRISGMGSTAAGAWPANFRALYVPFIIERTFIVTQLWLYIATTVAGATADMGIYRNDKKRLVSAGSTSIAGATANTPFAFNITDTTLTPGFYWLGSTVSTVTTLTVFRHNLNVLYCEASGMQAETLASTVLPDPATMGNLSSSGVVPYCGLWGNAAQ